MSYLIAVLVSLLALLGFFLVVALERRQGRRLFAGVRAQLDRRVLRITFVLTHIDWGGFFAHMAKLILERIAHDLVHWTLLAVRTIERTLTRMIRTLRERVAARTPLEKPAEGSQLIATIVRFRKNLRRERPEVSTPSRDEASM